MTQAILPLLRRHLLPVLALAFTLAAALPAAAAPLSAQDQAALARVEDYLTSIRSLDARFLQIAPDGALSEGRLYLRRPGRLRFEYDEPSPVLVVADGLWMVYHDKELQQTTRLPLAATPLAVLVRDRIAFGDEVQARSIERSPGTLRVTLQDPQKPKEGSLTLVFSDQPMVLRQWVVTDAQGLNTTVTLSEMKMNVPLANGLFVFHDETPRGQMSQ